MVCGYKLEVEVVRFFSKVLVVSCRYVEGR